MLLHATGDRAALMALNAFERAQRQGGGRTLQRIEHFGEFMLGPDDLAQAKRLGVQ
jgi:predicted amidohydrolase YtcJ